MELPDELCATCSDLDFFSLFTGPRYSSGDGYDQRVPVSLGTLAEINANTRCPFCRLLRHSLYEMDVFDYWSQEGNNVDPSKIRVKVHVYRNDYGEEMRYINKETRDLVASRLEARLHPLEGLSDREKYLVTQHYRGNGIHLLSPDSIDPARPLLNGYKATTTNNSLDLLQKWMRTCVESHTLESNRKTCCQPYFHKEASEFGIRVIDVNQRTIVESDPAKIDYAALSYVWGKQDAEDVDLKVQHGVKTEGASSVLPATVPKIIEDAILVCKKLSISFLWVDRYCIDQADLVRKGLEIDGMGYRFLYAKITLIAGMAPAAGLLPESVSSHIEGQQRIETVQGRKYITAIPSLGHQIRDSQWSNRAWTMQEGQLANRCAFFGQYDISFLCKSGQWRESLHSGPYGHEAEMPGVQTDSYGYHVLSWLEWLNKDFWKFSDYDSLLMSYTPRHISFESDKLNAITGCFNLIADIKGMSFVYGLPTTDFHYALLWTGAYDRAREGFPSWAWAGWHCLQQMHSIYPLEGTCSLKEDGHGNLRTVQPDNLDTELAGLLIALTEAPHRANKCSQRFADITLPSYKTNTILTITSEMAHFSLDIIPCTPGSKEESRKTSPLLVPSDFDSTNASSTFESASEYRTPYDRFRIRDDHGNTHIYHYPRWYDHWPPLKLNLPNTLRGETLTWLLQDGIELVMILELKLLEGDESLKTFHLVLCLGIDRREEVARRCGMFCLPKDIWDKACPTVGTVTIG